MTNNKTSKMMIKVIEAKKSDINALRELFLKIRHSTFFQAEPASYNLLDFDKETEGENILIAIYGNTLVGFISVWLEENFIHHLYVDENYQKRGIGTRLLRAVVEKANFLFS